MGRRAGESLPEDRGVHHKYHKYPDLGDTAVGFQGLQGAPDNKQPTQAVQVPLTSNRLPQAWGSRKACYPVFWPSKG